MTWDLITYWKLNTGFSVHKHLDAKYDVDRAACRITKEWTAVTFFHKASAFIKDTTYNSPLLLGQAELADLAVRPPPAPGIHSRLHKCPAGAAQHAWACGKFAHITVHIEHYIADLNMPVTSSAVGSLLKLISCRPFIVPVILRLHSGRV